MFIPVLLFSGIGCIMFIAGMLNCMPLAIYIILICGWICLCKERDKIAPLFRFTIWGTVGTFTCIYIYMYLKDALYPDGDTLTHWAVVVREIVENNRLPNFMTEAVSYTSYPTGTAGFIYFFVKAVQYGEGQTMFAQGLLLGSCILPLFAFCKRGKGIVSIVQNGFIILALLLSLHFNVRLDSLQVDNVLSLLSVAGVCIALYYLNDPLKGISLTIPIVCMLSITKNSGLFFCSFIVAISLYSLIKNKEIPKRKRANAAFYGIIVPLFAFPFLWYRHIAMVFEDANMARHSVSISYMLSVFRYKGAENVHAIIENYMKTWFSLDPSFNETFEWMILFGFFVLMIVGKIINTRMLNRKNTSEGLIALSVAFFYFLYKVLLLGMYLFNMPGSDAVAIASYGRYLSSALIIIFLMGVLYIVSFLNGIKHLEQRKRRISLKAMTCALCLVALSIFPGNYARSFAALQRPDYTSDGVYRKLSQIKTANALPNKGARILVYAHSWHVIFYSSYCFRSSDLLWSDNVEEVRAELESTPVFYDYFIVLDHDEEIDQLLNRFELPPNQSLIVLNDYLND